MLVLRIRFSFELFICGKASLRMSDAVSPATPHSGLEYVNGNVSQFPLWPQYTEQNTIYEQLHPSFSYLFAALFLLQ